MVVRRTRKKTRARVKHGQHFSASRNIAFINGNDNNEDYGGGGCGGGGDCAINLLEHCVEECIDFELNCAELWCLQEPQGIGESQSCRRRAHYVLRNAAQGGQVHRGRRRPQIRRGRHFHL